MRLTTRHVDILFAIIYLTTVLIFCGAVSTELLKYFTWWALIAYAVCMLSETATHGGMSCLCIMSIAVLIGYTMIITLNPFFELDFSNKFNQSLSRCIVMSVHLHVIPCMYFIYRTVSATKKQPVKLKHLGAMALFMMIYTMVHPSPSKTYNIRGISDQWLYVGFALIIFAAYWIHGVIG